EINEKYNDESFFRRLNEDGSDINILMGSRAFYEGWDSNRPNIILYINIGKGKDAKKFVLQSIGRGVRIEPLPNKRRRLQFLRNNNEIDDNTYNSIKDKSQLLETLFVFGTKAKNLREVVDTMKEEKQEELLGDLFEINPSILDESRKISKLLLIPVYKESERVFLLESSDLRYPISEKDLKLLEGYVGYIGDKVAIVKFDCQPKVLDSIKKSFEEKDKYYKIDSETQSINNPEILMRHIIKFFSLRTIEFDNFKKLENEIIHFRSVRISKDKMNNIIGEYLEEKRELKEKLKRKEISIEEYTKEIENLAKNYGEKHSYNSLDIKYIQNHYYIPVLLSRDEKLFYISHIIRAKSEVDFLEELEGYLAKGGKFFSKFDWWIFSKIDETLDEVYIPYFNPNTGRIDKFKPDFIFWLKKGNDYTILFVDPKGTEYTDAYRKIDGYRTIFEENGKPKVFKKDNLNVRVLLLLKTSDTSRVPSEYKKYWFDGNWDKLLESLEEVLV
ncbi:MAG: restriction endonuclease subunit R, partial [Spirochaetes bacterium]|nr:restriction endonuclease subunit R [Spirochaetota bacterium]